jgi:hypothetical protein
MSLEVLVTDGVQGSGNPSTYGSPRWRLFRRWLLDASCVLLFVQGTACAPVVSTLRPARVLPQGDVHVGIGYGFNFPVGALTDTLVRAKDLVVDSESGDGLSDAEIVDLVGASLLLLTNAPLPSMDFQVAYGLWANRLELDLRKSSGAWRLGTRFQILRAADHEVDLSVGLGASKYSTPTVLGILEKVGQAETSRFSIDVPVLAGWSWEFGHLWMGPKALYTAYDIDLRLNTGRLPVDEVTNEIPAEEAHLEGSSVYIGGQLGGAVGYRYVWVTAEITVMQVLGSVDYRVGDGGSLVQGSLDPGGLVIAPNIGIMASF